ncbi:MAG: YbaB/EbfC family nucleoid-associated protein [Candidatus Saccharibacteria bacterium]|nr:YbaB/EbfC family nucleoid-associated protein [Candidatus Saccharibacteria bacterium]
MAMGDKMKLVNSAIKVQKIQKSLEKEIIEVDAGDGAVIVQIAADMKIKDIKIDPSKVDLDNIHQLEHWLKIAIRDGMAKAQEIAAKKMQPLMGGLGNLGF